MLSTPFNWLDGAYIPRLNMLKFYLEETGGWVPAKFKIAALQPDTD